MNIFKFKKDKFLFYPLLASFILFLASLLLAFLGLLDTNNLLILHFDGYKGIDFLGEKKDIFNVVFLSLGMIFLNFFLAKKIYFKERFLSYLLAFMTPLFSLLIFICVFVIISIN
ncbi:hypothetical protein KJ671_00455 [Patescibacteria group bacterium]|nr:hypothetical protein [Patescibacteria group bacterium]